MLKPYLQSIYQARDNDEARRLISETLKIFEALAPKAMETLEDVMAVMNLLEKYRKRLRTTNSIERLNQEVRRRERVIRIYPNEASVIRLLGSVLIEQDEKWSSRKYLNMDEYYQFINDQQSVKNAAAA